MNADGTGQTRLTNNAGGDQQPWSPDGNKIAFDHPRRQLRDLLDERRRLEPDQAHQQRRLRHSPAWSPNGAKIAFALTRDGNAEIYAMNADGSARPG